MKAIALLIPLFCHAVMHAQNIRILKNSEAMEFRMGKVVSKRMVHPDMGAKNITLNYSPSVAGHEFSQHVHDSSDDTIIMFKGAADLRQGDSRHRFTGGQSVYVPAGQIHGTVTVADGTEMISFQTPPDLALYTGGRDSSKAGAAPPKGVITPGAVKYVAFSDKNGLFWDPAHGAPRIAVGHRKLAPGASFSQSVAAGQEAVIFVREGTVQAAQGTASAKDAIFVQGPAELKLKNAGKGEAIIIHALAPPKK
jgi:quercetin dioxygenase-like cupin family protein